MSIKAPAKPNITPAAPVESVAPASKDDYHEAAFKEALQLEGLVKKGAPAEPASELEAHVESDPAEEAVEPAAKAPPKADAPLDKSFAKLANATASLRKEQEALKPYAEVAKVFRPEQMQALARAMAAKDPLSVLAAVGLSYTDVAKAVVGQGDKKAEPANKEAPREEPNEPAHVAELRAEIRELQQERFVRAQEQVTSTIAGFIKESADKYPHLSLIDDGASKVRRVLEDYYQRTGGQPGETPTESFEIAAAEVEAREAKEAVRWEKVLSGLRAKRDGAKSVDSSASESPTSRESSGQKTLTNKMAAPAAISHEPEDREELYATLVNDKSLWG